MFPRFEMTDVVGARSLDQLLHSRIQAGGPFLTLEDGRTVDWSEIGLRVEERMGWLEDLGVSRGTPVCLFEKTGVELLVSMFALYRMGALAVMPNVMISPRELAFILTDSRSRIIITDENDEALSTVKTASTLCSSAVKFHTVTTDGQRSKASPRRASSLNPEAITADTPATLLYTSGSTASPKGVLYSHGNHIFAAETMTRIFGLTPDDQILHHFPLYHTNGICQMFCSVVSGLRLILRQRFRSGDFYPIVEKFRPTFTFLNATQVKMLINVIEKEGHRPWENSLFGRVGTGGEFSMEIRAKFESHHLTTLIECYGTTETIAICCANPLSMSKATSCGVPAMGYEMGLAGVEGPGTGEIFVRSFSRYGMFRKYWRRPGATREALFRGTYRTGDIARRDEDGYFYFLGRTNEIIKRAGENISPREVESVLGEHPTISEVAVIGAPDELREEVPIAFVVASTDELTSEDLTTYCAESLATFKIPARFHFLADIPHLETGKVDKSKLRAMAAIPEPIGGG
jgi:acyl-CoA synthetase (AMP-forming)/AMP-acid ligase II